MFLYLSGLGLFLISNDTALLILIFKSRNSSNALLFSTLARCNQVVGYCSLNIFVSHKSDNYIRIYEETSEHPNNYFTFKP